MATYIGHIGEFNETAEDFESYVERMDQWAELNGVGEEKKAGMLLPMVGANAYILVKDILTPEKPKDKTYAELREALLSYCSPKPLIIAQRYKFYKRGQKEGEYVADYVITLKRLSATCDFGEFLKQALRDRLVCYLRDENIQRRLLTMKTTNVSSCQ